MAMSVFEKRCLAVELLLVEAAPWLAEGALDAAAAVIRAGLTEGLRGDELDVRLHALALLDDHRLRNLAFPAEAWIHDAKP